MEPENTKTFNELDVDTRILSALKTIGWETPTKIQQETIKMASLGKDIIGCSRTGSGKSGAFLIPIINKILKTLDSSCSRDTIKSIILVPTKELSSQIQTQIEKLLTFCSKEIKSLNVVNTNELFDFRADVVIGTPSKVLSLLKLKRILVGNEFLSLVIDEADLMFSLGYSEDLTSISHFLPSVFQTFLLSATMIPELEVLNKLYVRNPVVINVEDSDSDSLKLKQFWIECREGDGDKFLYIYFLLKLKLIQGKCLIFVESIDRGYKLLLFLEQFGIKPCVLNSELPHNSRYHLVQQFNHGVYEYLIATDDSNRQKKEGGDQSFGVSRGVDFQAVHAVINFDFPSHPKCYTHRVGRTARGTLEGWAFSFLTEADKRVFQKVEYKEKSKGREITQKVLDRDNVEAFRYRCEDAIKQVSKSCIKEARLKQIQQEILNSEKLKTHFQTQPNDLHALRHDKPTHATRIQPHLKNVPDYLLPKKARKEVDKVKDYEVTFHSNNDNKKRKREYNRKKTKNVLKTIKSRRNK
jgi:ATP-dependent RNA helicase DDX56/DBP9